MTDQALDEIHGRDGFLDIFIIFMVVVVESDHIDIIVIDSGGSNDWSAKITTDVFDDRSGIPFEVSAEGM